MNVGLHEVADGLVDEAVALQGLKASESVRYHSHPEMPTAVAGPGMTLMQVTLVGHRE
jgi:hypothetical protein